MQPPVASEGMLQEQMQESRAASKESCTSKLSGQHQVYLVALVHLALGFLSLLPAAGSAWDALS